MGGEVLNCLNILGFPSSINESVIADILTGAINKVNEAGGVIAGGHTISSDEIIYGLSVNGIVKKNKLKTNSNARVNQEIILTKKLGTGVYSKEININDEREDCLEVVESMTTLNKKASEILQNYNVSAVTDVTGFGLLGHLYEVTKASGISAHIFMERIPLFERTREYSLKYINGGMMRNNGYFGKHVLFNDDANTEENSNILFDPQTSGGLLIFVDSSDSKALLNELHDNGIKQASIIGKTKKAAAKFINVFKA